MTTDRLDALLVAAAASAEWLYFGVLLTEDWGRWKLQLELAGGDYTALRFNELAMHALASAQPPPMADGCVRLLSSIFAAHQMRLTMMNAISNGWPGNPEFSERWASKIDMGEEYLRRNADKVIWRWPAMQGLT